MKPYYSEAGIEIYHGDCREVLAELVKLPAHLALAPIVITDPPYGIALKENGRNGYDWNVIGDEDQTLGVEVLSGFERHGIPVLAFASPKKPWPGKWRQHLVWDKGPAVGGGGDRETCWKFDWELIQVARVPELSGKRESSVLRYWIGQADYAFHPNQKPLPLLQYLIGKATREGDTVFDPFAGSGSTLVAAKQMGRKAVGIEVRRDYCDIIVSRLAQGVLFGTGSEVA